MDIRLEVHPLDPRQWRVCLNQFFFEYSSHSCAEGLLQRIQAHDRSIHSLARNTCGARSRRRHYETQWA